MYEGLEAPLNNGRVSFPDVLRLEQQLLGLIWRGAKITHPSGEHNDLATAGAGCISLLYRSRESFTLNVWSVTESTQQRAAASGPAAPSRIDGEGGGLVVNPRGGLERYRDARGDEPREGVEVVHVVLDDGHRSVCRACLRGWIAEMTRSRA